MTEDKYFFNNDWNTKHPTINFFTFVAYCVEAFGHKCIVEHVQDGEIWSDEEYWGTIFYDFANDRYTYMSTYLDNGDEIERILKRWMEDKSNPDDIWDGKISEDFVNDDVLATDKSRWAVDFYKSYIASNTKLNFEDYYKEVYKLKENE
jgi:hypothetical protein